LKVSGDEHRWITSGKVFQARGLATAKARSPSVERRIAGTVKAAEGDVVTRCSWPDRWLLVGILARSHENQNTMFVLDALKD